MRPCGRELALLELVLARELGRSAGCPRRRIGAARCTWQATGLLDARGEAQR